MAYVGTPDYLDDDRTTLASILQGEAGNQGAAGMQAVGAVIQNRANQNFNGYGTSLIDQALAHKQFQGQSGKPSALALATADAMLSGQNADNTGGALYYANPGASTAAWARNLDSSNALKIGDHYFTNNTDGTPFKGNGQSAPLVVPPVAAASVIPGGSSLPPAATAANPSGIPGIGGGADPVASYISSLFAGQQAQQKVQQQLQTAQVQAGQPQQRSPAFDGFTFKPVEVQSVGGTAETNPQGRSAAFAGFTFKNDAAQQPTQTTPTVANPVNAAENPFGATAEQQRIAQNTALAQGNYPTATALGAGIGRGVQEVGLGAQQLLGHGMQLAGLGNYGGDWLVNDANQGLQRGAAEIAPFQQASPVATGVGTFGGNVIGALPAGAVAAPARGLGMLGNVVRGATTGAVAGAAATPVDPNSQNYWADKAWQTALGAGTGGVLAPVAAGIGKLIGGVQPTPEAQQLIAKGVTPTVGQILGGDAAVTEAKLTSMPIMGTAVAKAQQQAVRSYNTAVYNEVLSDIGEKVSPDTVGHAGIQTVKDKIQNVYNTVLPKLTFKADQQFVGETQQIAQAVTNLPPQQQAQFQRIAADQLGKMTNAGTMNGATLKGVQSELTRESAGYTSSASFDDRKLGDALNQLRTAVMNNVERVSAPEDVAQLQAADASWAKFIRLQRAATSQGAMNNQGVILPSQLQNAVKASDTSVRKGNIATGDALMQDLSTTGQNVLGNKYPDSGTGGRLGLMSLLTGESAASTIGHLPTIATAYGLGTLGRLAYTPTGQRVLSSALFNRPAMLQTLGRGTGGVLQLAAPGASTSLVKSNIQQ